MDLYYAMTNYHVLCCILHRITLGKENKAVLWVSSYLTDIQPELFDALKKSTFFDEVLIYKETMFLYFGDMHVTQKMIDEEKKNIHKNIDKDKVDKLSCFDNIYICQDTHSLGIYLNEHGIKYNFFEDGCGILSNKELLLSLIKKFPAVYKIIRELKCVGESSNVVHRFGDLSEQAQGYHNEKDIDFSVKKILAKLGGEDIKKILEIYGCKKYNLGKKKKELLLTWKYNSAGFMTLDEQRAFFSLLADYFTDEKDTLFIKPHPSDIQPDYKNWFKDAIVIDRHMPSELLPFTIDGKFEKGITNWSTSIYGLRDILKDIVNFDKEIDDTYRDFNKYFAVVEYLNTIKDEKHVQKLILKDINKKQLLQLLKYYVRDYDKYYQFAEKGEGIYIIKQYEAAFEPKKCIILNGDNNIAPQGIIKITTGDNEEIIYLNKLPANDLQVEKEMRYSGYKLLISTLSTCEYINQKNKLVEENTATIASLKEKYIVDTEKLKDELAVTKNKLADYKEEVKQLRNSTSWKITKPMRKISEIRKKK